MEGCDFSDNFHDPEFGWGERKPMGGMVLTRISKSVIRNNKANRVWDGLSLIESDDNEVAANDLSHCSDVCLKMWIACRNVIRDNNLSYGLRIKPGEVHARDSTSVLVESGSNDNRFYRNNITHGGDGVFIRVLNGWVSTGNLFIENDCSYANNNGFEAWSPGNTYVRNQANHCSYGFWLGGSDQTVLTENEAAYNGQPDGFQVETHFLEHIDGDALPQLDEAEQKVFGADDVVVETVGFLPRQSQYLLGARREIAHALVTHIARRKVLRFASIVQPCSAGYNPI